MGCILEVALLLVKTREVLRYKKAPGGQAVTDLATPGGAGGVRLYGCPSLLTVMGEAWET